MVEVKVLVALDGSPSSVDARDLVAGLPWPPATIIRLLTAYEGPSKGSTGFRGAVRAEQGLRRDLEQELARMSEPLIDRWTVERRLVRDRPASAIVASAANLGADLIVLGSRGRGALASMLLGSVPAEVVEHAPCPVLVARGGRVSRLLVASDGSDTAGAIPARLGGWGVFAGLPAEVISVAPPREPAYEFIVGLYTLGSYPLATDRAEALERHRRFADEVAHDLTVDGLPATSHVRAGDAADEILAAAQRSGADLIVTGSRGLRGLDRLLLGSVARNVVLHAPCSVLVMRPEGATATRQAKSRPEAPSPSA
jgi:nucleotide-binding universal stress UspA family protein